VTCYNPATKTASKTFAKFKDKAYSGVFRSDGNLLVAGGETPVVQVFEVARKTQLRVFKGHKSAVHAALFSPDKYHVATASDDKTFKYWDLTSTSPLFTLTGHKDYIRTASACNATSFLWATGSYDHSVRLWDIRNAGSSEEKSKYTMKLKHGCPVESVLMLPGGNMLLSAGGNTIKVWDILSGGKLMNEVSNHQKTITSLILDGTGTRLISAGLDGHVKIYDICTFLVTHGLKYNTPILSVAISNDNSHLAVGMSNGELSIRTRVISKGDDDHTAGASATKKLPLPGTTKFFNRGMNEKAAEDDFTIDNSKKKKLKVYDSLLKAFKYQEALDAVLESKQPLAVYSLLEELIRRNGLKIALNGRDEVTLEPFVSYLIRFITMPRYTKLLIEVSNTLFDIYAPVLGQSVLIDELFTKLRNKLVAEIQFQKQLMNVLGTLDVIISNAPKVPK
jgi:U3 small nucleolar RNA-associated protein 15